MGFRFPQRIFTPKGPATFLAYVIGLDGTTTLCQVSRMVPASEFSKDVCIRGKPDLVNYSPIDFASWQKSAVICVNELYKVDEITDVQQKVIEAGG